MKYWTSAHYFGTKAVMYMITSLLLRLLQSKELRTQNEQLQTVNTSLGSEVNKLQKQLELLRSEQEDGGQVRSLEEELEHLRKELEEAHTLRNKMEEEHINEKMDLTQVGEGDRPTDTARVLSGYSEALLQ